MSDLKSLSKVVLSITNSLFPVLSILPGSRPSLQGPSQPHLPGICCLQAATLPTEQWPLRKQEVSW